ncbi:hypothetical protein JCGZ_05846 [Jatropha curcas]|uniref:Uncharacterized protein n=1 Tax=Jatropha curcas TaxID=180498 RepID=A0A067J8P5_JATCU|nr:hypothetical protein JCGZ_05846 [Jatropha curcas]
MVEQLVYQRWLNACLRFEIQSYPTKISSKPSNWNIILSTNSSNQKPFDEKSDQQLVLDDISSNTSSTESEKTNSSIFTRSSSSSSEKKSSLRHYRVNPRGRNGLNRRFSTSMVPSKQSDNVTKRVSFTDLAAAFLDKEERE